MIKVIFGDMILHYDLDLEDSKPIFLEDNFAHDDASLSKFGSITIRFCISEDSIWINSH